MHRNDTEKRQPSPEPETRKDIGATTLFDREVLFAGVPRQEKPLPALSIVAGRQSGNVLPLDPLPITFGRDPQCDVVLLDRGISRQHFRVEAQGRELLIVDLDSTNGVYVNGVRVRRRVLAAGDRIHLGPVTVLRFSREDADEIAIRQQKYEESIRDDLTGSYNRRHFDAALEHEIGYSLRHGEALSVLLIDVDHFKRVNDAIGHQSGDEVLRLVSGSLLDQVRTEDLFARYGGEEFAVLLRGQDAHGAWQSAERLRRVLAERTFHVADRTLRITASIGIATLDHDVPQTASELMADADGRLYTAKRAGRNRTSGASRAG